MLFERAVLWANARTGLKANLGASVPASLHFPAIQRAKRQFKPSVCTVGATADPPSGLPLAPSAAYAVPRRFERHFPTADTYGVSTSKCRAVTGTRSNGWTFFGMKNHRERA
jgi:hypothetical protein